MLNLIRSIQDHAHEPEPLKHDTLLVFKYSKPILYHYNRTSLPLCGRLLAHFYLAITSTYPLPFFPFRTVPPFLACGAPIKSSMLLAPLWLVVGLDGGADGGPPGKSEVVLRGDKSDKDTVGSSAPTFADTAGEAVRDGRVDNGLDAGSYIEDGAALVILIGGVFIVIGSGGTAGTGLELTGGGPLALTALEGGPLGGGGGAAITASAGPPFLLTHFFSFSS